MKRMLNVIILLIIFTSCNNKNNQITSELKLINKYLEQENLYKKQLCDKIIGCNYYEPDTVFYKGEKLIEAIKENKVDNTDYSRFIKISKRSNHTSVQFELNENYGKSDNIKLIETAKIRLILNSYFDFALIENMRSHYQVNAFGILSDSYEAYINKRNNIKLYFSYFNTASIKQPDIVIFNDTIHGDGCVYEWIYKPRKKGIDTIRSKVLLDRWGEQIEYEPTFIINVK